MRKTTSTGLLLVLAPAVTATWLAGCSAPARAAAEAPQAAGQAPPDSAAAGRPAADSSATTGTPTSGPASPDSSATAQTSAQTAPDSSLQWDAATKTVTFRLVAGPFTFNGYGNGGATLTVPPGSNNVWNFVQNDGTPHSAEVASGSGPVPNSGGDPAIPRAYTTKVVEGLVQGGTDVIKFTAPDTGSYRIICGVPGHALSGMWIWLKVDPSAKAPAFGPTAK